MNSRSIPYHEQLALHLTQHMLEKGHDTATIDCLLVRPRQQATLWRKRTNGGQVVSR